MKLEMKAEMELGQVLNLDSKHKSVVGGNGGSAFGSAPLRDLCVSAVKISPSSTTLEISHIPSKLRYVNLNITDPDPISLRGQMLLATPSLSDGTFDHSVIFIAEHNAKDGAIGAIINHPIGTTVGNLVSQLKKSPLAKLPVLQGGPVGTEHLTFTVIYMDPKDGARLMPRISAEAAEVLVDKKDHLVQAIVGHSAWSPGQLEDEMERNTWISLPPPQDILSHPHDLTLWKRLLSGISPYHALISQAPKNPMLN